MTSVTGRIRNTEVRRESDPKQQRRLYLVLGMVLAIAGPAVFYVWLQTRFVAAEYRVQELRQLIEKERESQRVLDVRLQGMTSPNQVRARVRRMGLDLEPAREDAVHMIRIEEDEASDTVRRAGADAPATTEGRP